LTGDRLAETRRDALVARGRAQTRYGAAVGNEMSGPEWMSGRLENHMLPVYRSPSNNTNRKIRCESEEVDSS
jgi:hypothetical protein